MILDIGTFCTHAAPLLQFVGYLVLIFKIAIPVIIIVMGMMDFGKAVISEKDEDIKKQAIKLGRRALAGIVIFFIPTFIKWLFSASAGLVKDAENSAGAVCVNCVTDVTSESCAGAVAEANS